MIDIVREASEACLDIGDVITNLRVGRKARRNEWHDDTYITYDDGIIMCHFKDYDPQIFMITQNDVLAEDWVVVSNG